MCRGRSCRRSEICGCRRLRGAHVTFVGIQSSFQGPSEDPGEAAETTTPDIFLPVADTVAPCGFQTFCVGGGDSIDRGPNVKAFFSSFGPERPASPGQQRVSSLLSGRARFLCPDYGSVNGIFLGSSFSERERSQIPGLPSGIS